MIGAVTVVPTDAVTVVVVIGVATVTVAATVAGNVGTVGVGSETVGARSVEGNCAGATTPAVEERAAAASPPAPCVGSGAVPALETTVVSN